MFCKRYAENPRVSRVINPFEELAEKFSDRGETQFAKPQ
jgi:hypothetical protein